MGPSDTEESLGPVTLGPDDDTIWLRVTQTSPTENWRYSFALVSFITDDGADLGTTKVYGNLFGEIFAIGVRRTSRLRTGSIRFVCRHYNLAWLKTKGAPTWDLSFQWESGQSGSGSGSTGSDATLGVLGNLGTTGVDYAISGGFARVRLSPT